MIISAMVEMVDMIPTTCLLVLECLVASSPSSVWRNWSGL